MEDENYKDLIVENETNKMLQDDTNPETTLEEAIIHTDYAQDHNYIKQMKSGVSPLGLILKDYDEVGIPIFSTKFLTEVVDFLLTNPDESLELIDYILSGPENNILRIPHYEIIKIFLDNVPLSLDLLAKYLIRMKGQSYVTNYFMECGGFGILLKCMNVSQNYYNIALIFEAISNASLIYNMKSDEVICAAYYSDPDDSFSINVSDDEQLPESMRDEKTFRDISNKLMQTGDHEIQSLLLHAFANISEKTEQFKYIIADHVAAVFHTLKSNDLRTLAFTILSTSLDEDQSPPQLSTIWHQVPRILRYGDFELTSALCSFVKTVVTTYSADYICDSELFGQFVAFAKDECPYKIKESIASCLAYIISNCNEENLHKVVQPEVVALFHDFIDDESNDSLVPILHALTAIVQRHQDQRAIDDIVQFADEIEELQDSLDDLVSDAAVCFIECLKARVNA